MIKIEHADIYGFDHAIRGARNPMNSWPMSDSYWDYRDEVTTENGTVYINRIQTDYVIGPNDMRLLKSLAQAGSDHGKYLRMIQVWCDVTAPFYWYKELDTYRFGVEKNSCSTMHKLTYKPFDMDDFSTDHMEEHAKVGLELIISWFNSYRDMFLESGEKRHWWQIIQLLPTSYNQMRTVTLNYENLINMYHARKNHKLDEWHTLCDAIRNLPYSELITGGDTECSTPQT
jgi:hypothetical protein